jgi:hypothetical protein
MKQKEKKREKMKEKSWHSPAFSWKELAKCIRDREELLLFFVHEPQAHKGSRVTEPNRSCACHDFRFSSSATTVPSTITAKEVKGRITQLKPDSERVWGKMNPAQALAHCSAAMEMAMGEKKPPRIFIGRLLGRFAKKSMIANERPMPPNVGTDKSLAVSDERDFVVERQRLSEFIDRFATGGPGVCTRHPHFFFGPLTPVEWAALMYQHLDHHLRQFRA